MTKKKCPWCSRTGYECWVMPCLELEQALEEAKDGDETNFKFWIGEVGATATRKKDGSKV